MAWPSSPACRHHTQQAAPPRCQLPAGSKAAHAPSPGVGGWTGASTHRATGSSCPHSTGKRPIPATNTISFSSKGSCLAPAQCRDILGWSELLAWEPQRPALCRMAQVTCCCPRCQLLFGRSASFKQPVSGKLLSEVTSISPGCSLLHLRGLLAAMTSMARPAFAAVLLLSTGS